MHDGIDGTHGNQRDASAQWLPQIGANATERSVIHPALQTLKFSRLHSAHGGYSLSLRHPIAFLEGAGFVQIHSNFTSTTLLALVNESVPFPAICMLLNKQAIDVLSKLNNLGLSPLVAAE